MGGEKEGRRMKGEGRREKSEGQSGEAG